MAIARESIRELDVVEITAPIGRWPVGTRGTVVGRYGGFVDVDIAGDGGRMLDSWSFPKTNCVCR